MPTLLRLLLASLLATSAPCSADESAALPAAARTLLQQNVGRSDWQSIVVGHIRGGESAIEVFAANGDGAAAAPDAQSRFELGGSSAAFNGLLLADLASAGRVRLDDPISRYLPSGVSCADARVCAITLGQLASHSSGLPPWPSNLFPRDSRNPWRDYTESDLVQFLLNYPLPTPTSATRESPLGNVLLGWILGRAHGAGHAAALAERISVPLGLTATNATDATRFGGDDSAMVAADSLSAVMSLRSSVEDQLRLLRAMLKPGESPVRTALLLSRQPRVAAGVWGLGWRIERVADGELEWPLVWQSGEAGGHASFIGFRTDRQEGVVLLGQSQASLATLGLALLSDRALPQPPRNTSNVIAKREDYTGLYQFSAGNDVLLRMSGDGLTAQLKGRLGVRLRPLDEDIFGLEGFPTRLSFQRDLSGQVDGMRWAENGVVLPLRRLSKRAPRVERQDRAEGLAVLAPLCGLYAVQADVLMRFGCDGGASVQFSGTERRPLIHFAADRFASTDDELELQAQRDAQGNVVALQLSLLGETTTLPRVTWAALPASIQWRPLPMAAPSSPAVTPSVPATDPGAVAVGASGTAAGEIPWIPVWAPPAPLPAAVPAPAYARPATPAPTPTPIARPATRAAPAKAHPVPTVKPATVEVLPEPKPRRRPTPPPQWIPFHDLA